MQRFNLGALIDRERDGRRALLVDARDPESPREWTGAALEDQADAVARGLLARGLARGDRVAILSANRAQYLTAYYGTMRAGMVSVPVNIRFPEPTVHYVLADCGARFAFVDTRAAGSAHGRCQTSASTTRTPGRVFSNPGGSIRWRPRPTR